MARSDGYNTRTRQLILDYLINNRQHAVSASNILEHLEAQGASPNPTTVYRYLDKLAGEQRIMKYVADKGERAVFQYVDELIQAGEFTNLKGMIYFTDGRGIFPEKKPDYDAAFVFLDDGYDAPDVPVWAIKLVLQSEEI